MVCPNCGVEIKRFDLAPNCKKCGVNILYFNQEAELTLDAKKTELEFAKARAVVGRIKTTYIGDALSTVRMILGILTVAALAIPFFKLTVTLPFANAELSTGAIGLYQLATNGMLQQITNLFNLGTEGALAKAVFAHLIFFALTVVGELCMFITFLLEAINIRRGTKWLGIFSGFALLADLGSLITAYIASADAAGCESISVGINAGGFVLGGMLIVYIIINIILYKKNPQYEISEIDRKRIETLKQIKEGKITYDELTLPVFETEEEREKRINLFGRTEEEGEEK